MNIEYFQNLIKRKEYVKVINEIQEFQEADVAEIFDDLSVKDVVVLYRMLPKEMAADVFSHLDVDQQAEISLLMSEEELEKVLSELYLDDKVDLLEEMPANVVKKILNNASQVDRKLINQFLNYKEDTAGSIMTNEFVHLKANMTVSDALTHIKKTGEDKVTVYTCYVTNRSRKLKGIVSLKELVLSEENEILKNFMEKEVIYVHTYDDQEVIVEIFKKYDLLALPVVDKEERMVGIITFDDVMDVMVEENTEDIQKMAAINPSDEEYLDVTAYDLAKRRVGWLIVLMFSATISEFITGRNLFLTTKFAFLSTMIPMLMSTGGNAGAQSSTLIIRGLTLGEVEYKNALNVLYKELKVGLLIGIILGALNYVRIFLVNGNVKLASIVGLTLIGTSITATTMGGLLPILAKKAGLDPATMANPLITTITDALTLIIFFAVSGFLLR